MLITITPGVGVTPAEIQAFDHAWMSQAARDQEIAWATRNFTQPFEPGAWGTGETMEAMVRMFHLTHDRAYLDHLRALSLLVLSFRDDRRTDRPGVEDPFRGRVMPAWGTPSVSSGYLHHTSVDIAGIYAYPIAAFARIVAEHPPLWGEYGSDAVDLANAILETLKGFADELQSPRDDSQSLYYAYPRSYRTLLTQGRCTRAYNEASNGLGPDGWAATEAPARLVAQRKNCNDNRELARYPAAHNQTHALAMAMIEAWRAVDSSFYVNRVGQNALADWARTFFPTHIAGIHRWWARHTEVRDGSEGWLYWRGADGVPSDLSSTEDTSHGGLTMRYLGVLVRSVDRVNRALPPGHARIDLGPMRQRLARTFLRKVGRGADLAHLVDGTFTDDPRDAYNHVTNGWLDLADLDASIYDKCRDVALRVVGSVQPYLSLANHASLLANKPAAPIPGETIVPEVRDLTPTSAASTIRSAGLVPKFSGSGAWVATQSPRAGTVVARGSTVTCGVRSGPRP